MKKRDLLLLLLIPVLLVACQTSDDQAETPIPPTEVQEEASPTSAEAGEGADGEEVAAPATLTDSNEEDAGAPSFDLFGGISVGDFVTEDSGLQYFFHAEGDGQQAQAGQMVMVNLTGWLEDGSEIANSATFGGPVPLPVGTSTGIVGLDEALTYLSAGSSARFIIPVDLVVDEDGASTPLPESDLAFEIEVVKIIDGPPEAPETLAETDYTVTDSGLKYYDLVEGDGPEVEPGNRVYVHYTGWLEDNTIFDSSVGSVPLALVVDSGQVIPGWDEGLQGLKVGGRRQLVIPPELGYGEAGSGPIPANSVLIFEVELVEIGEDPPEAPREVADDDYTVTNSGLKYYDFEEGDGPEVEEGDQVAVEYTGWLEDGTMFDSSIGRQPFSLVVGQGQVIAGWDEGLLGLKPGGQRQLVIPPELGYGESGSRSIPANSVLIFEVELVPGQ